MGIRRLKFALTIIFVSSFHPSLFEASFRSCYQFSFKLVMTSFQSGIRERWNRVAYCDILASSFYDGILQNLVVRLKDQLNVALWLPELNFCL